MISSKILLVGVLASLMVLGVSYALVPPSSCCYTAVKAPFIVSVVVLGKNVVPAYASIVQGDPVTLVAQASGGKTPAGPFTYQWYSYTGSDGVLIPGATGATFTFNSGAVGGHMFYAVAKDSAGESAQSNIATISVTPSGPKYIPLSGVTKLQMFPTSGDQVQGVNGEFTIIADLVQMTEGGEAGFLLGSIDGEGHGTIYIAPGQSYIFNKSMEGSFDTSNTYAINVTATSGSPQATLTFSNSTSTRGPLNLTASNSMMMFGNFSIQLFGVGVEDGAFINVYCGSALVGTGTLNTDNIWNGTQETFVDPTCGNSITITADSSGNAWAQVQLFRVT